MLPYPPASEIRYAVWLKNLALQLPAYATRYQLPTSKLLELHCIALDFIDLLVHRMHAATGQLTVGKLPPVEETAWDICAALMQSSVEKIVTHIQQHPAYSVADAHDLRLPVPVQRASDFAY